jgi:hypothetical protein
MYLNMTFTILSWAYSHTELKTRGVMLSDVMIYSFLCIENKLESYENVY